MASLSHRAEAVTVAFVGDQGTSQAARQVLELVVEEGADLLVLQGDLGYDNEAEAWIRMMDDTLGEHMPVVSVIGNHDEREWPIYQAWLRRRMNAVAEPTCVGDPGIAAVCSFGPIAIVQTAPGVDIGQPARSSAEYARFVQASFSRDLHPWRICSFHKNQSDMQTGAKRNEVGWNVYEACRGAGAMVVTGHEHAYSRTHLMADFDDLVVAHRDSHLVLEPGRSFAVVSGLGGRTARKQMLGGDWWASIYTRTQRATQGALFCRFEGVQARCEFKTTGGLVIDRFTLESRIGEPVETSVSAKATERTRRQDLRVPLQATGGALGGEPIVLGLLAWLSRRNRRAVVRWAEAAR